MALGFSDLANLRAAILSSCQFSNTVTQKAFKVTVWDTLHFWCMLKECYSAYKTEEKCVSVYVCKCLRTSWGQFVQLGTKASSPIVKTQIFESVVRVRISQVVVMVRVSKPRNKYV